MQAHGFISSRHNLLDRWQAIEFNGIAACPSTGLLHGQTEESDVALSNIAVRGKTGGLGVP